MKNMHDKINKIMWVIAFVLALGLLFLLLNKETWHEQTFHYFDTDIKVRIYHNKNMDAVVSKIDQIYKEYDHLTDAHKSYDGIVNIHTIRYNKEDKETLTLDNKLYEILSYVNEWNKKSQGIFKINQGATTDGWNMYLKEQVGIPSDDVIQNWKEQDCESLYLLGDSKIKNNHPMIELGKIPLGFANDAVTSYLKKEGIEHYLIQENGNATAGLSVNQRPYKVALSILNKNNVSTITQIKNKTIVTYGATEDYYEYNDQLYSRFIDSNTSKPAKHVKQVTVIASKAREAYVVGNILYLTSVSEGEKIINNVPGVEAKWEDLDGNITSSSKFYQYEV